MSSISFNSPTETVDVRGTERAWFNVLIRDIGGGILHPSWNEDILRPALPEGHYLLQSFSGKGWDEQFRTSASVGDLRLMVDNDPIDISDAILNTAFAVGNDALKLAARIHGSCEIHCWVDGHNRGWLAGIIKNADAGIFRADRGWGEVAAMLLRRDDEPVVLSYSVCDGFPNSESSEHMPPWPEGVPERWDALSPEVQEQREELAESFYDLTGDEQWASGMSWLRKQSTGLELRPDTWDAFRFAHGLDVMQVLDKLRSNR